MNTIIDSPLVGKKYVGLKVCEEHEDAAVVYQGRICPLCKALNETSDAQAAALISEQEDRLAVAILTEGMRRV